jgi:hypothetical protein
VARAFKVLALASSVALLAGCSVFYPNWGATSLPEEPANSTSESTESSTEATAEPEASESATETAAPAESETAKPEPKKTTVEIIMAVVEPELKILTVVAQLPGVSDEGGSCTFRFQAGDFEKKLTVKAEPSASYTQCYPIEVPLSQLKSGAGLVTVSYQSDLYVGASAASSVDIP